MDTADLSLTLHEVTTDYMDYMDYMNYTAPLSYGNVTLDFGNFFSDVIMLRKMTITFYSIIFPLGIIGNGLVIWIAGFRMKRTISAIWFLNLAIADFLCCASLPMRIAIWVVYLLPSDITICKWNMIVFNLNMSASVFLLTAMSIDRCVSIMWPFWAKVHRTCKLVRINAAIVWVLSLIWTGLMFISYAGYFQNDSKWCADEPIHTLRLHYQINEILPLIRLVIMFVIPFLIISISYVTIFIKLRKSKRPQRSQRPYRIITAVILCFFICWSPYYIWPLITMFCKDFFAFHTVNAIIITLAYLNSCINPIIYVFMTQDFKHSFLRSIPFRLEKALSEHPNDLCEEQEDGGPAFTTAV